MTSKYTPLWEAVSRHREDSFTLSFAALAQLLGFPIDHGFLNAKKELAAYGWQVAHISRKTEQVSFRRCPPPAQDFHDADVLLFFDGRPDALLIFRQLAALLEAAVPAFTQKVGKSQIGFYNRHLFAMASLPRRKAQHGLMVSFGLNRRLDAPRVAEAAQPYPGRWTHHVLVPEAAGLDAELLDWLREAYAFAAVK